MIVRRIVKKAEFLPWSRILSCACGIVESS
ncbi:hypothetical protein J2756_000377 [Methanobacterium aggregans]|nr:hypothetical protein [Methanobacterium aggregans]